MIVAPRQHSPARNSNKVDFDVYKIYIHVHVTHTCIDKSVRYKKFFTSPRLMLSPIFVNLDAF